MLVDADRKFSEALRFRRLRAAKKAEMQDLRAEVHRLERELSCLQTAPHPSSARRMGPQAMAMHVLQTQNAALRERIKTQRQLARVLSVWVSSQCPSQDLPLRYAWKDATLLAHPLARRQGYEWLSRRVYHNAVSRCSRMHPFGDRVDDALHYELVTADNDDNDAGVSIARTQGHIQHTFFGNYKTIAAVLWDKHCRGQYVKPYPHATVSPGVLDHVTSHLVYYTFAYDGIGVHAHHILSKVEEPNRIVLTVALVADDECHPLAADDLRQHGFCWFILERVTDTITLWRSALYVHAPITAHGVASLAQMGQLYGLPEMAPAMSRASYIERIRSVGHAVATDGTRRLVHATNAALDSMAQEKSRQFLDLEAVRKGVSVMHRDGYARLSSITSHANRSNSLVAPRGIATIDAISTGHRRRVMHPCSACYDDEGRDMDHVAVGNESRRAAATEGCIETHETEIISAKVKTIAKHF
ncbi:Aste57867_955 [Aphanomyces stellatus]|uniref:Aste57867_955 protein n=1 Tax=Aphanomyces stellatus TaxID=120398 RepID=A0A485K984_9STRA|nr:hypothetical protein As57867_000954 [Aphanomyces stellatus]VFT78178.1 Aste57867_955 [Aphanomyces stellatus]